MGDIADMINDDFYYLDESYPDPDDYLDMTDAELVAATSFVRDEKHKGIRAAYKKGYKLSKAQRWCLAKRLADRDLMWIKDYV